MFFKRRFSLLLMGFPLQEGSATGETKKIESVNIREHLKLRYSVYVAGYYLWMLSYINIRYLPLIIYWAGVHSREVLICKERAWWNNCQRVIWFSVSRSCSCGPRARVEISGGLRRRLPLADPWSHLQNTRGGPMCRPVRARARNTRYTTRERRCVPAQPRRWLAPRPGRWPDGPPWERLCLPVPNSLILLLRAKAGVWFHTCTCARVWPPEESILSGPTVSGPLSPLLLHNLDLPFMSNKSWFSDYLGWGGVTLMQMLTCL